MNLTNITLYKGTNNVFVSLIFTDKYVYRTIVVGLMQSRSGAMFNQEKRIICSRHQRKRWELE